MDPRPIARARLVLVRRWLLVLGTCALTWVLVLVVTDGFAIRLGPLRLSSHNPRTPFLLAIAGMMGALVLSRLIGEPIAWRAAWSHARATVPAAIPIAFMIAAAVLDFHQLFGAAPLWLDEEMIALNLRDRSFAELGGRLWLEQSAPYGWLFLQRALMLTLGTSEIALRLVPTLSGIGTYLAALWIGRRWLTWPAGLALVLLCVFGHSLSHFRVEVKHYSADAFWALLLPALAVWASEAGTPASREHRSIVWWTIAAVALWLANGAILVAPVSALFLLGTAYVHGRARATLKQAAWGLVWLVSFALHYLVSLRHTAYLRDFWAAEFPPTGAGVLQTIWWLVSRLNQVAVTVAGSDAGVLFSVLAILGFAWSARRALAMVYAGVTLSGFVLAALHVVPMFDRFALWMIPALYVGIVLAMDRAVIAARDGFRERNWLRAAASAAVGCAALVVCVGIVARGAGRFHMERPTSKQGVDDRTAVTWLMGHRQPGDALISTPQGLPAIWWYGGISIAGDFPSAAGQQTPGTFEVVHRPGGDGCALPAVLKGHRRALVYIGFPDMVRGFDDLLFSELDRIGTITAYREVTPLSRAAVVDLTGAAPEDPAFSSREVRPPLRGCVGARAAVRR